MLCREGELAQEFFVIIEGDAEVTKGGEARHAGDGDFFGEIALIVDIPRTATVTAATPLRFFVLSRQSFWSMMDGMPGVERKILQALAKRALTTTEDEL